MDKNSVIDYVGRLRTKPEHVRRRIALGTAVGTTAVVAAVWLLLVVTSGALSINPAPSNTTVAQGDNSNTQVEQVTTQTKNGFQNLLGAVGFANTTTSTTPGLTIVDSPSSSQTSPAASAANQSPSGGSQTVIPF